MKYVIFCSQHMLNHLYIHQIRLNTMRSTRYWIKDNWNQLYCCNYFQTELNANADPHL